MTDLLSGLNSGSAVDAQAVVTQVLTAYGLQGLASWAWGEITNGASSDQVLVDMQTTPQFQQRFPGIQARQAAGLPAISPADYVNYEKSLGEMENQYGMPKGSLTNPSTVGTFIGNDVSPAEVQSRVQNGFDQVAYAPPEVRQMFTTYFGVGGDAALASYFLDPKKVLPVLQQQAAAASIGGTAGMAGIHIGQGDALTLAQLGKSGTDVGSGLAHLEQNSQLFNASITEKPGLEAGKQGVEAEFGLNATATQEVIDREQQRQAQFQGGGAPYTDQYGAKGAGAARPV